jgi:outer membrane lipoprotein SlyB
MKMAKGLAILSLALAPGFVFAGDQTIDAAIGGAVGGALGGAVGEQVGGRDGAIIGAGVGAAAGAAINTDDRGDGHDHDDRYHRARDYDSGHYHDDVHRHGSRFCPPGQAKKGNC